MRIGQDWLVGTFWLLFLLGVGIANPALADEASSDAQCYEFVRAEVAQPLGPAVNVTGSPHMVRRNWRSPRGWDADVLIKWPRPPARVCGGDQLSLRFEIKSFRPYAKDPGGYAGSVFFTVTPSFMRDMRCSDSDKREVGCGVYLMIPETQGWLTTNSWIKAPQRAVGLEFSLFNVSLSLDTTGAVNYLYRIVPRKASDAQQHHDLDDAEDLADSSSKSDESSSSIDSDGDGLSDEDERRRGTDPNDPDSDDDRRTDADEILDRTDPLDPNSVRSEESDQTALSDPSRERSQSDSKALNREDIGPAADPCRDVGPGTWIVIAERSGPQGKPARIPVSLCGADRVGDLNLTVGFATDVLQASGFERGAMLGNALFDVNLQPPGTIRLGLADNRGLSGDGYIAYLDFNVIGAEGSSTVLNGRVTTATRASDDRSLGVQVKDGRFTVTARRKLGDGDGDDRITSLDALMALRMSIGKIPVDLILDVNSDGQVTALDARWILQMATGLRKL